jgi:hypothetical protein
VRGDLRVVVVAVAALLLLSREEALAAGCERDRIAVTPRWVDFADQTVGWRDRVFGHKNITVAIADPRLAASLRKRGARTTFWEMNLFRVVGTPTKPLPKRHVRATADRLVVRARRSTGLRNPWITFNEMLGSRDQRPFRLAERRYRENLLILLSRVCERGAVPWLLVPSNPRTDDKSRRWWKRVGEVSGVIRETFFSAPQVMKYSAQNATLVMRARLRGAAYAMSQLRIPRHHQGIVVGFQSGGIYGRNGLRSRTEWLQFVALKTAAARQVAREHRIGTVWSWGWGTYNLRGTDADKPLAACTYLWVRAAKFCALPRAGGPLKRERLYRPLQLSTDCFMSNHQTQWGLVERARSLSGNPAVLANALASEAALRRRFPLTRRHVGRSLSWFNTHAAKRSSLRRLRTEMSNGLYMFLFADALRRDLARAEYGSRYDSWLRRATTEHLEWLGCPRTLKIKPVSLLQLAERRLD